MPSELNFKSLEEIRRRGLEALAEVLGPVDAVRFLQSFDLVKGTTPRSALTCWILSLMR